MQSMKDRIVLIALILNFVSQVPAEEALNRNGDPTLGVNALTLKTHDIEASGNFYEALGFVVEYSQLLPPWKTLSIGHRQHLNLQGVNATDPFLTNGSPVWGRPVIYVKSVDEVYARAMANGFLPEFPPSNAAWGERFFHIKDPAGHEIAFARPLVLGETTQD